jgi:hypothetical protein
MNENKLQPEIKERFLELPEMVQNIILESGWEKTTRHIVEQYNLRIDQGAAIENEVMLTMFGFEKPENFKENVVREAKLDSQVADKIVDEINRDVFQLIKDKLVLETENADDDFSETPSGAVSNGNLDSTEDDVIESREDILSEVEKIDEPITQPLYDDKSETNLQENSVSPENKENNIETQPVPNIIEQNLNQSHVTETQKIDPYREPTE